jgi:hypothetical protein
VLVFVKDTTEVVMPVDVQPGELFWVVGNELGAPSRHNAARADRRTVAFGSGGHQASSTGT